VKKTYTEYLNELSGNRMDVLERLISTQYKKFKKFYKIVSGYSSDIAHISYRFSTIDSLDVEITVNPDIDADLFAGTISSDADEKYDVDIYVDTKVVYISINSRS
jgi:hypothetical protein